MNGSVIIYGLFHEIVDRNHDISSVVHLLGDRVELIHGGHPLAEACGLCVVLIERFLRIDYKRMIENVGYFVDVDAHTGTLVLVYSATFVMISASVAAPSTLWSFSMAPS